MSSFFKRTKKTEELFLNRVTDSIQNSMKQHLTKRGKAQSLETAELIIKVERSRPFFSVKKQQLLSAHADAKKNYSFETTILESPLL